MISPERIPPELIEQFAKGNGSVFVGAGLSKGANLPDWAGLMKKLTEEVGSPKHTTFPDIAQHYENLKGRPALLRYLSKALNNGSGPTEAHKKLANLPVPRIYTTNFDRLLEAAFDQQGLGFEMILTDQDLALMDSTQKFIVKLHGDLRPPRSLVITSNDYENYLSDRPGIANLLGLDLHSRTVLFLGYSFSDMDLRQILSNVSRTAKGLRRPLFTVQLNPTKLAEEELRRREITVIKLSTRPNKETEALDQWLEEFIRCVRESPLLQPAARQFFTISFVNSNLEPRSGRLLGRQADLARVMIGLRLRYPLIAIKGFAGVGKTSLAIEVGRIFSERRSESATDEFIFEYVVWISANDKPDQEQWLDDVLHAIAITTNNPAITQQPAETPEEKRRQVKQQVEELLQSYKILVIIDNFETMKDPDLIEWLERIPEPSKALITTRGSRSEPERVTAWTVNLGGLGTTEAIELMRQYADHVGLESVRRLEDRTLYKLACVTYGNPQAMKLALGLVQGEIANLGQVIKQLDKPAKDRGKDPAEVVNGLLSWSWKRLPETAHQILLVTPLFVGVSSIRKDALLAVTGLPSPDFDQGARCLKFGLLEEDHERQRYVIHPMTRAFVRNELNEDPEWECEAKRRCMEYFLDFVSKRVIRSQPKPPYWNALVGKRMVELDPEWPSIRQVMAWADEGKQDQDKVRLVELVMLLVHYMDSRFLNRERLEYVGKAVTALQSMKGRQEEEALLRIDALGWTHVEELELPEADEQISRGLNLAQGVDLRALGLAWKARVSAEKKDLGRADKLIREAQAEAQAIDCSPWIRFRVNMAAGDIALKQGDSAGARAALDHYECAEKEADIYGGEGHQYQIGPRIGLAYLGIGGIRQLEEAERKFKELSGLEQIPIGKLYAEYGLALVAYERGNLPEAQARLNAVKAKLSRRTRSNLLLRLIEEQETRRPGLRQGVEDLEPSLSVYA